MPHGVLDLVGSVLPGRDAEDLVEFLQRELLGLGHEEEHQEPADETPSSVPAKCTLRCEGADQMRPGETQDEVEAPGGGLFDLMLAISAVSSAM